MAYSFFAIAINFSVYIVNYMHRIATKSIDELADKTRNLFLGMSDLTHDSTNALFDNLRDQQKLIKDILKIIMGSNDIQKGLDERLKALEGEGAAKK